MPNAGLKSSCHRLAARWVGSLEVGDKLGERTALRSGDLTQRSVLVVLTESVILAAPVEAGADFTQHCEPVLAVLDVKIDRFAAISARGDVVKSTCELDTEWSRHKPKYSSTMLDCKT